MEFRLEVLLSPHMWEVLTCHMRFQCFKGICGSHHTRFVSYQLDSLLVTCRSRFSYWTLMFGGIVCVRRGRPPPFWCAVLYVFESGFQSLDLHPDRSVGFFNFALLLVCVLLVVNSFLQSPCSCRHQYPKEVFRLWNTT